MRILVSGYYGFQNAGDEAILGGMIRAIRELDPGVEFTVISGRSAQTRQVHGVEAVSRNRPRRIWAAVGRADLVISGGGSLLQDVTGFKSIPYYLGVAAMGLWRRKPVMFYAQGVGPIRGAVGRSLTRLVGNRVDLITVRDQESAAFLHRLGVRRPPVHVTADAALALEPGDPEAGRRLLRLAGVPGDGRPVIGVAVRPWKAGEAGAEPALAGALDSLARASGGRVVFIPMQVPHDVAAAAALRAQMREPAVLLTEGDRPAYTDCLHLVAACDLLVGMRYHALVFAAMAGVPLVGLSYDPKNDAFLRRIGMAPAATTAAMDAGAVLRAGLDALGRPAEALARLRRRMAEMAAQSRENARLALDLAGRRK